MQQGHIGTPDVCTYTGHKQMQCNSERSSSVKTQLNKYRCMIDMIYQTTAVVLSRKIHIKREGMKDALKCSLTKGSVKLINSQRIISALLLLLFIFQDIYSFQSFYMKVPNQLCDNNIRVKHSRYIFNTQTTN